MRTFNMVIAALTASAVLGMLFFGIGYTAGYRSGYTTGIERHTIVKAIRHGQREG